METCNEEENKDMVQKKSLGYSRDNESNDVNEDWHLCVPVDRAVDVAVAVAA